MEVRELLESFGFDSEKTPVIPGSALHALENTNEELGKKSIFKLMDTIDSYVPSKPKILKSYHVRTILGHDLSLTASA